MACAARTNSFTSTLEIDFIPMGYLKKILPNSCLDHFVGPVWLCIGHRNLRGISRDFRSTMPSFVDECPSPGKHSNTGRSCVHYTIVRLPYLSVCSNATMLRL
mmetsp:Transcript_18296/g.52869  ORF Transcript_18296/g.52869 Transcript_18296/m.52869 type:complete len:103 (+) Transcript_18296:2196-2504(+)